MKLNTNLKLNPNFSRDNVFPKFPRQPLPGDVIVGKPPKNTNRPIPGEVIVHAPPRPGRLPPCSPSKPNPGVRDGILVPGPILRPPTSKVTPLSPRGPEGSGVVRVPENKILNCGFGLSDGFDKAPAAKRSR